MSSILKALKKVEQQKAPRPHFELDVAAGIVREKSQTRRRPWAVPALMAAVAVLAALATYGMLRVKHPSPAPEKALVTQQIEPSPVVPATPAARQTEATPAAAVSAPVPPPLPAAALPAAPIQATVRTAPARLTVPASSPQTLPAKQPARVQLPMAPPPAHAAVERKSDPAPTAPAAPNLKLTGIAWQKDSASRLAVINGSAVSQGAIVEGAKIEEILPDKVRFSVGQRTFEISLGKIQN